MWLFVPVRDIPPNISQPDILCLALYLWAVFFKLLQLCWVLDMTENRFEKRERYITDIVEHVDVLDKALLCKLIESWDRHREGELGDFGVRCGIGR